MGKTEIDQKIGKETDDSIEQKSIESNNVKKNPVQKKNTLVEWLRFKSKRTKAFTLSILIFLLLSLTLIIGYLSYYRWLPSLWDWGFNPVSWKAVLSVLGAIYLVIFPFMPFSLLSGTISGIFGLYSEEEKRKFDQAMAEFEHKQKDYEVALKESDSEDLIPLINYSRLELNQYHEIGLRQTQKSYSFSIIAMWIGFLIIAFGILSYIIPSSYINQDFVSGNFQILTISSGIIVEIISALFLWIYRSSINRLTYFYNRQVFIHNALFAFKIANTMKEPDSSKKVIVEKILEFGITSNSAAILNLKKK